MTNKLALVKGKVELVEFNIRVFPANHLAMVLTKQTYNNQGKYKKPKDIHKKPEKLNLTKPN